MTKKDMFTHHKAIVLQNVTLHYSPILLKQDAHIISLSVPTQVADKNFDGHVLVQPKHLHVKKKKKKITVIIFAATKNTEMELGGCKNEDGDWEISKNK